jgi:hypothetical protein
MSASTRKPSPPYPSNINPLNPTCHLLAFLGAHHILNISRIRVKSKNLTLTAIY